MFRPLSKGPKKNPQEGILFKKGKKKIGKGVKIKRMEERG